jgi:hypothetical protein
VPDGEGSRGIIVQVSIGWVVFYFLLGFCPPSVLMAVLRFSVAAVLLLRRISSLKACSDDNGVIGEVAAWLFWFLYFSSSMVLSSSGGRRFLFPHFCERAGFFDGILVDGGVGGLAGCVGSSLLSCPS